MTVSRRPRRQGVVYGPPSFRRPPDNATVLGRLIGAIVVIGSFVALLVGALAVIGSGANHAQSTPTPTLVALASPSTTPTLAIATPIRTPSPTPAPSASPSATPFAVVLVDGPGKITFASDYDASLNLISPHVEFSINDNMAWRANIGQPVGKVKVDFNVYRVDTATMAETVVHTNSFIGQNANAVLYYAKAPVSHEVDGPGIFVMRYSVNGTVISEGYFQVNP
jgi:hypothetical protein